MDQLILFAQQYVNVILSIHLFGVVIGFGGAVIADILFFKFLNDERISKSEANVLRTMSLIIWAGALVLICSGILLLLSDLERYTTSAKFLLKMVVVGVIVLNGIVLNFVVTPKLESLHFGELKTPEELKTEKVRGLVFATGAISAVSWWTAFILGLLKFSPAPFPILLGVYLSVVVAAIIGSQIANHLLAKGKIKLLHF